MHALEMLWSVWNSFNLNVLPTAKVHNFLIVLSYLDVVFEQVNKLKRIPNAIGDLTNLSMLGLARNQLEYLPATLKTLTDLKYIDIHVNKLHTLLPEEDWHALEKLQEDGEVLAVFIDTKSPDSQPSTPASRGSSAPATPSTPSRRLRRHKSLHLADTEDNFKTISAQMSFGIPSNGVVCLAGLRDLECSYNELETLPDLSGMVRSFFIGTSPSI
jgi:hypothetical protein